MRLLIVNDEVIAADAMQADIPWKHYGINEAIVVYNVRDAKKVIMKKPISILLCDIEMPGENGIELIRWIRRKELEIECIFITCHAKFEYAKEAVALGCKDYILIPARDEDVGKAVQNVVHRLNKERINLLLNNNNEHQLDDNAIESENSEEISGKTKLPRKRLVYKVVKYILSNVSKENLTVTEIADHFYLHPVYLNRIFKKEMNLSVSQYIINQRMELAARLLMKDGALATIVAETVGYVNYPHFSVMFKKHFGCSPTQYKEKKV